VLKFCWEKWLPGSEIYESSIFEADYKINFVDKNNVFVGFDYSSNCCERFGYYIGIEIPKKISPPFD
jgi:hypothetical protein